MVVVSVAAGRVVMGAAGDVLDLGQAVAADVGAGGGSGGGVDVSAAIASLAS